MNHQELIEKIKVVAKTLGWRVEIPSDEFQHVYAKATMDGFTCGYVSITSGRYQEEGRIRLTAYTDQDSSIYHYGEPHLTMSVSAAKTADQIAKDVQRRFVPPFLEIVQKAQAIEKRRQEYNARLESCLGRLKGDALEALEVQNGKFNLHLDSAWGTVQYTGDDQVTLDFHSVPAAQAERMLAVLRAPEVRS